MTTLFRMLLVSLCLLFAASTVEAGVPGRVMFAARLADAGAPIDGPVTIKIDLYRVESGGTSVWSETHDVTATEGLVSVGLGDQLAFDTTVLDGALFLEVTVGSTVLSPRLTIGSVPYALSADRAAKLGDLEPADVQRRITAACPAGSSIRAVDEAGAVTCEPDDDTPVTAGTGIAVSGSTVSVDTNVIQHRVTGTCSAGASIRAISASGTVTCEPDTDTDTTYNITCPTGQFVNKLTGTGSATCAAPLVRSGAKIATSTDGPDVQSIGTHTFCALQRVDSTSDHPICRLTSVSGSNGLADWTLTADGGVTVLGSVTAKTICEARCL